MYQIKTGDHSDIKIRTFVDNIDSEQIGNILNKFIIGYRDLTEDTEYLDPLIKYVERIGEKTDNIEAFKAVEQHYGLDLENPSPQNLMHGILKLYYDSLAIAHPGFTYFEHNKPLTFQAVFDVIEKWNPYFFLLLTLHDIAEAGGSFEFSEEDAETLQKSTQELNLKLAGEDGEDILMHDQDAQPQMVVNSVCTVGSSTSILTCTLSTEKADFIAFDRNEQVVGPINLEKCEDEKYECDWIMNWREEWKPASRALDQ